jgi:hypothetical protein
MAKGCIFLQIVNICKVVHIYKMIIFHVPWTFEWQITIYNVIRELIIAHMCYNTYHIFTIVQTYSKFMMNTKSKIKTF